EIERRFGYERGELAGLTIGELMPGLADLLPQAEQAADSDLDQAAERRRHHTARRKDGSLIAVAVGLRPLKTPDSTLVVVSVGDHPATATAATGDSLDEPFAFEHFVADLSGQFINAPAATLPAALASALQQICERFALEGSGLHVAGPNGTLSPAVSWHAGE